MSEQGGAGMWSLMAPAALPRSTYEHGHCLNRIELCGCPTIETIEPQPDATVQILNSMVLQAMTSMVPSRFEA
jgi:hypothetical protein